MHPRRQPAVEPFGEGFCAHAFAPIGESLIGWYKKQDDAVKVLLKYYEAYQIVIDAKTDEILVIGKFFDDCHKEVTARKIDPDTVIFDGGFGAWAARHLPPLEKP